MAYEDDVTYLYSSFNRIECRLDNAIDSIDKKLSVICNKLDDVHSHNHKILSTYVTKKESNIKAGVLAVIILIFSGAVPIEVIGNLFKLFTSF